MFFSSSYLFATNTVESFNQKIKQLTIYVPGAIGGGYDHTAKVFRTVLLDEKLVEEVKIINIVGAGGTLALTHFIHNDFQNDYTILLGGRSMMGAALYNNSQVSVLQTTAIARLNGKPLAIAVPNDSPIKTLENLFDGMLTDISSIKWIGGSAGAADNIFLKDLLNIMRLNSDEFNYHPVPGGGNAVSEQLISGNYTAAVSTLDELMDLYNDDLIRIIAVTSSHRVKNINVPTLTEKGIDLSLLDWHGVFVSQKTDMLMKQRLSDLIVHLANSHKWQSELKDRQWENNFLDGQEFVDFVSDEQLKLATKFQQLPSNKTTKHNFNEQIVKLLNTPFRWAIYIALLCLLLLITLFILKLQSVSREVKLQDNLNRIESENQLNKEKLAEKINGISQHIEQEFVKWQLTVTEKEIALMLLKGLTFKDIAKARCKSERTVRQQAGAIYAKSSLANRSDLAAYFLEDFMTP
jgi:putative tricarboxylic transport membrane protein